MAESYLGLALARMRQGEKPAAVAAIAAAMLLEPQRSLFLSYRGKMLHELGRPGKALDILAQARAVGLYWFAALGSGPNSIGTQL